MFLPRRKYLAMSPFMYAGISELGSETQAFGADIFAPRPTSPMGADVGLHAELSTTRTCCRAEL